MEEDASSSVGPRRPPTSDTSERYTCEGSVLPRVTQDSMGLLVEHYLLATVGGQHPMLFTSHSPCENKLSSMNDHQLST